MNPGLESIVAQDLRLLNTITEHLNRARENIEAYSKTDYNIRHDPGSAALKIKPVLEELSKAVEEIVGLRIEFVCSGYDYPYVVHVPIPPTHVLHRWREMPVQGKVTNRNEKIVVDLKKSYIHLGPRDGYDCQIEVGFDWFVNAGKISTEACAAAAVHEIGHAFVVYEFLSRRVHTDYLLRDLMVAVQNKTGERREITVNRIMLDHGYKIALDAKDYSGTDAEIMAAVAAAAKKKVISELGADIYDDTTWETLADDFAARHGAGKLVAEYLQFIEDHHSRLSTIVSSASIIAGIILFPPLGILVALGSMWLGTRPDVYQPPKERATAIKHSIIAMLKADNLPSSTVVQYLRDLDELNKIIQQTPEVHYNLFEWFGSLISSDRRRWEVESKRVTQLHELANNSLFVRNAQLKLLLQGKDK